MIPKSKVFEKIITYGIVAVLALIICSFFVHASEGFLSDSCVQDKSCCNTTYTNSLDFVCFRNDTNSSFTYPFEIKDLYGEGTNYAYLSTRGKFVWVGDDINDYGGWQGIGRTALGTASSNNKILEIPASSITKRRATLYGVMGAGSNSGSFTQRSESYVVPLNEYTIMLYTKIKCTNVAGCTDGTGVGMRNDLTSATTEIDNVTNIDGGYSGYRFNWSVTSSTYEWLNKSQWIIAFNTTPNILNYSSFPDINVRWTVAYNNNITLIAIFTLAEYEANISDWFANPVYYIDRAINETQQRARAWTYPSSLNNTEKNMYYWSFKAYDMNTMRALPQHYNVSKWKNLSIFTPASSDYPAIWEWDSYFACIGLLSACVNDGSVNEKTCLEVCKNILEIKTNVSTSNTEWVRTVRDKDLSSDSQNADWGLIALHLYNRSVIDLETLNESYEALKDDFNAKNSTSNGLIQISATEWCRDDSDTDAGWDGSDRYVSTTCQVDITGWMAQKARTLGKIANILNNSVEETMYNNFYNYYKAGLNRMWDNNLNDYCDINSTYKCTYSVAGNSNSYLVSSATAWALSSNASNSTQDISILSHWQNESWLGTLNPLPTMHTQHPNFNANGTVENWQGTSWSPPIMQALMGLINKNHSSNVTWLSTKIKQMVINANDTNYGSPAVMGCEAYDSNYSKCAPVFADSSFKIPYLWSSSMYILAINNDVDLLSIYTTSTSDSSVRYYNITHPRIVYSDKDYYNLSNTSTYPFISNRFSQYNDSVNTARNATPTLNFFASNRMSILAFDCFSTNQSTSCSKAKTWLFTYLNASTTNWTIDAYQYHVTIGEMAKTFDWIYFNLTEDEREDSINKFYNITITRMNATELNINETRMSNNNGQADDLANCEAVYVIKGSFANDTAMAPQVAKCEKLIPNFWRSYFDTSFDLEGTGYWAYHKYAIDASVAYRLVNGSNPFTAEFCNLSKSIPHVYHIIAPTGNTGRNLTHSEYGDSSKSANIDPRMLAFIGKECNASSMNWLIDIMWNNTDEFENFYGATGDLSPAEFTYYNFTLGEAIPSATEYYDGTGFVSWRTGWNLYNDTIIQGWSRDQSVSHPNADNGNLIIIYNGKYMLTEGGYRNGTGENPKDVLFHNIMMVNNTRTISFGDRGKTDSPAFILWGATGYPTSSECTSSNYTSCSIKPNGFRGQVVDVVTSNNYNSMRKIIPYYTFTNVSNVDVYLKNVQNPVVIRRWVAVTNQTHNLSFLVNTEYPTITSDNGDMLVNASSTLMRVKAINYSDSCSWSLNHTLYNKYDVDDGGDGTLSGQKLYISSLNCNNVQNHTNIMVYSLYRDDLPEQAFSYYFNSTHEGINYTYNSVNYKVMFSKTDFAEAVSFGIIESSSGDGQQSGGGGGGGNPIEQTNTTNATIETPQQSSWLSNVWKKIKNFFTIKKPTLLVKDNNLGTTELSPEISQSSTPQQVQENQKPESNLLQFNPWWIVAIVAVIVIILYFFGPAIITFLLQVSQKLIVNQYFWIAAIILMIIWLYLKLA